MAELLLSVGFESVVPAGPSTEATLVREGADWAWAMGAVSPTTPAVNASTTPAAATLACRKLCGNTCTPLKVLGLLPHYGSRYLSIGATNLPANTTYFACWTSKAVQILGYRNSCINHIRFTFLT